MDACFMRSDLGYDAIILVMKDKDGIYQAYLLADQYGDEKWIFEESDPIILKEKAKEWCQQHLPKERQMAMINLKDPILYKSLKTFLQENRIPYEVRKKHFYVLKPYVKDLQSQFN